MAIGTIADDTIDPGHEQESAPRFPQLGVLEEARRRPGFPGSELAWAPDRSSRFALTTLWESTGACSAWQTQQLLPVPRSHPDVVGLGQPGTVDILEVEPGPASAHATSSNGQVAATPALTRGTAARRTAIKANLRGSRLLLLVRHADAGDKDRWQGPDRLRPLSLAGQAEAAGLVIGLDDYPIGRILTSPTLRCQQTVQPLARDRRLRIESEVALGVDADPARVQALLQDPRLQDAVVYPRRSDRPGAHPAGRRRVGGRPAVAVAQGVDLAAGRRQRTTHPRPLPAAAGPGPCPEYGIGSAGPGPWAGCQFSARCLSHRDPRACGCWIDKKLSTRRCRNRGSWVVVAWAAYPSLTVAYQTRSATWIRISLMRETRRYNSRLPMTSRRSSTSSSADAAWR